MNALQRERLTLTIAPNAQRFIGLSSLRNRANRSIEPPPPAIAALDNESGSFKEKKAARANSDFSFRVSRAHAPVNGSPANPHLRARILVYANSR